MIEKLQTIKIKGRCFAEETKFPLFPNPKDRVSIIYGKNGSGKSTISKAFHDLITPPEILDLRVALLDNDSNILTVETDESIHVFNETYVDSKIKIEEDGLSSVILFGEQVSIQSQIDEVKTKLPEAERKKDESKKLYDNFLTNTLNVSPDYFMKQMENTLRTRWAKEDSELRELRRNSNVGGSLIEEIIKKVPSKNKADLESEYCLKKDIFKKTSSGVEITKPISLIKYNSDLDNLIISLLATVIEKPVLTEREEKIMALIEDSTIETNIYNSKNTLLSYLSICPHCFQPISEDYKKQLLKSISLILNETVEIHLKELSIEFPDLSNIDFDIIASLDNASYIELKREVDKCLGIIEKYKKALQSKKINIYTPIDFSSLKLVESLDSINKILTHLEITRQEYNRTIKERQSKLNELLDLNKQLAYYDIKNLYDHYKKAVKKKEEAKKQLDDDENDYNILIQSLQKLEAQKGSISLAVDQINNSLKYIFFKEDRLTIELRGNKYVIKSNGNDVLPKNVSLGERNIIALSYFFIQILANQDVKDLYKRKELLIIDDPVSSFDFENRVGILSFLKYQIGKVIMGNNYSKVVILSHDLHTIFDLHKATGELCNKTEADASVVNTTFITQELLNKSLVQFNKKRNEYAILLQDIFDYAQGKRTGELNNSIGNEMRRALEAFSTFCYKKSIEAVSTEISILEKVKPYKTYFENLMYRLVLHGESHYEEEIYEGDNFDFTSFLSSTEKQRTARDILCFIFQLNQLHIHAYLPSSDSEIKKWLNSIPKDSSFEIELPRIEKKRKIRLYDFALSAGTGNDISLEDVPFEKIEIAENDGDFAIKISGDSMEPDYPNGCTVLVRKSETLENGQIGAFYYDGQVYCKRYRVEETCVKLESLNSKYNPIEIPGTSDLRTFGVILKVLT